MGHPTLISTKSTLIVLFRSSAHLVMVSGKAPSSCQREAASLSSRGSFSPGSDFFFWGGNTHLHPEDVLGVVAFEQSPLGGLALQQVGAHCHLPTGDICSKTFADPSEREVSTLPGTAGTGIVSAALLEPCPQRILAPGQSDPPTVVRGAR